MKIQEIITLYDYNDWANQRILTTCAKISHEQFIAPGTFSWGGLRGTLVHTLDTEWSWRMICQGNGPMADMVESEFPTLDALRERWQEEEQARRLYLSSLHDDDLDSILSYKVAEGVRNRVLWHVLFHVVNHGMQHRSEAAALLTQYGQSPGNIDFTVFLNERQGTEKAPST